MYKLKGGKTNRKFELDNCNYLMAKNYDKFKMKSESVRRNTHFFTFLLVGRR
jgi:hypothetical protein